MCSAAAGTGRNWRSSTSSTGWRSASWRRMHDETPSDAAAAGPNAAKCWPARLRHDAAPGAVAVSRRRGPASRGAILRASGTAKGGPRGPTARERGSEMSGVMATTASGTSSGGAAVPRRWGTPAVRAAIIGTGLTLRLWLLFWPGLMSVTQYDDGPYFGSAVRLVHGVLPYRDYAFVQPPGITELMSPAALESYLGSTAWALVIGRLLSVLAGTAAVV